MKQKDIKDRHRYQLNDGRIIVTLGVSRLADMKRGGFVQYRDVKPEFSGWKMMSLSDAARKFKKDLGPDDPMNPKK